MNHVLNNSATECNGSASFCLIVDRPFVVLKLCVRGSGIFMPRDPPPPSGAPRRDVSATRARASTTDGGREMRASRDLRADPSPARGGPSPSARDMESLTVLLTVSSGHLSVASRFDRQRVIEASIFGSFT